MTTHAPKDRRMALKIKSHIEFFDADEDEQSQSELSEMEPDVFTDEPVLEKPFLRFRRIARAVKLLIQVCHVCKSLLESSVSQEAWFALVDNLAAAAALTSDKKKGGAFVTYIPNENKELEQVSFDVAEFMRHKKAEDYLTDDIRNIMKQRPGTRTEEQIIEVVRCMKNICKSFNEYSVATQKKICQQAFYDQYRRNRVLLRRGLAPDGIYFLLSGELVEKPEGRKQPEEIEAGQKFGEEDLVCGSSRRATVLSKDEVEILFLHRLDYRVIFNMSADSYDPKNLEICKNDVVFQHFPMQKLIDNPGTWSALRYKYGRLIVKDSNDIEWIYVIKSGEARVLKHLKPGRVDVKARRKKILQHMKDQSLYHKKKKILDFIADGNERKSCYAQSSYKPSMLRRLVLSPDPASHHSKCLGDFLPNIKIRNQNIAIVQSHTTRACTAGPVSRKARPMTSGSSHNSVGVTATLVSRPLTTSLTSRRTVETFDIGGKIDNADQSDNGSKENTRVTTVLVTTEASEVCHHSPRSQQDNITSLQADAALTDKSQGFSKVETSKSRSNTKPIVEEEGMALPSFVQIETLHPGHTFGLRSCLDHDERGPSVSLVSADCEVLAINKKFFMKHCDDALISLIRLKAKPFPSQTELVDRLDANMQWEEFKQETIKDFLKHRVRTAR